MKRSIVCSIIALALSAPTLLESAHKAKVPTELQALKSDLKGAESEKDLSGFVGSLKKITDDAKLSQAVEELQQAVSLQQLDVIMKEALKLNPPPAQAQKLFDTKKAALASAKKAQPLTVARLIQTIKKDVTSPKVIVGSDEDRALNLFKMAPLSISTKAQDALDSAVTSVYNAALKKAKSRKDVEAIPRDLMEKAKISMPAMRKINEASSKKLESYPL